MSDNAACPFPHGGEAVRPVPFKEPLPLHDPFFQFATPELWQRLRDEFGNVVRVELEPAAEPGQEPITAWLLLGYQENLRALSDPVNYTKDSRLWPVLSSGRLKPDSPLYPFAQWQSNAFFVDGAEHERFRAPIVEAIARFRSDQLARDVRSVADRLIDEFIEQGSADLVTEYAQWVPLVSLARMFGLDDADTVELCEAMNDLWQMNEKSVPAQRWLFERLLALARLKRVNPGPDFPSWMCAHPAGLTDEEVRDQLMLLIAAGHESSKNVIANTVHMLLTRAEFRHALASSATLVADTLDRSLWVSPPLNVLLSRYATGDVLLGGRQVRRGDAILIGFTPAHSDPVLFDGEGGSPYTATEVSRAHLLFGVGPHKCPAVDIARHMATTAVSRLVERVHDLRLAVPDDELPRQTSPWLAGFTALPVEFTPMSRLGEPEPRAAVPDDTPPPTSTGSFRRPTASELDPSQALLPTSLSPAPNGAPWSRSSSTPPPAASTPKQPGSARPGLWSRLSSLGRWLSRR
ncbi:cytochrome P450 [Allonocardiopsis opalescens]|uniref:Cytochrome P450 n=1 Tax=Allonocardiopsis opalescens TaxID=1144618 RepID=A0A2T0Q200_9ACTN|nr:cytochrome P450 [Allonocardiopsis opalescens]PRX97825.1 cytochrome P450 [Allonocardiopsis opalescens]